MEHDPVSSTQNSSHPVYPHTAALIIVDVQNDFIDGSLAVPSGHEVLAPINKLLQHDWGLVVATKDWHPKDHVSFASTHNKSVGDQVELKSSKGEKLHFPAWPDHCVQGTIGAQLSSELDPSKIQEYVCKGTASSRECYSAFADVFGETDTPLPALLARYNITEVYVCGLALDYCVMYTALDAAARGYRTTVILDATRPISEQGAKTAESKFKAAGVHTVENFNGLH